MVCFIGKTHHALIGIIFTSLSFLFVNSALFASYEPDCYSVERERNATIRILSLDGGAVRGIIPATILARLCQEAGLEVSDMFHVVGGSSAGGMIGTCLTQFQKILKMTALSGCLSIQHRIALICSLLKERIFLRNAGFQ
jgi:hypothetical protein